MNAFTKKETHRGPSCSQQRFNTAVWYIRDHRSPQWNRSFNTPRSFSRGGQPPATNRTIFGERDLRRALKLPFPNPVWIQSSPKQPTPGTLAAIPFSTIAIFTAAGWCLPFLWLWCFFMCIPPFISHPFLASGHLSMRYFLSRWRDPRRRLRVLISFLPPDAIPFSGQTLIQSTFKRVATGGIHKNKRKK